MRGRKQHFFLSINIPTKWIDFGVNHRAKLYQ